MRTTFLPTGNRPDLKHALYQPTTRHFHSLKASNTLWQLRMMHLIFLLGIHSVRFQPSGLTFRKSLLLRM